MTKSLSIHPFFCGTCWLIKGHCLIGVSALLCSLASPSLSEDRRGGGFFPQDFVSKQQLGTALTTPTPPPPLLPSRVPLREKDPDSAGDSGDPFFGPPPTATPTPAASPEPLVRGTNQRVTGVTGVVAGRSTAEALLLVAEAGRALKELQIPLKELFFFGDPFELSETMQKAFEPIMKDRELRDGFDWVAEGFRITSEVPQEYPVTHSPAWIIETAEGTTIIEGSPLPLSRLISSTGELLVPMGGEEIDPKAPQRGPLVGATTPAVR